MGRTVLPSASAAGSLLESLADGKTVRPTISQQPCRTCVKQIPHLRFLIICGGQAGVADATQAFQMGYL